jgi:hypothetical protein
MFVGKYFEHLKEPDTDRSIFLQMVYSKAKRFEKRVSNRGEYGRFCPTMRDEHHGNIELVDIKNMPSTFWKRI